MDDKRFYRKLKQEIKKTGNRKRRRFLKDVNTDPAEFEFGSAESSVLNGRDGKRKKKDLAKSAQNDTTVSLNPINPEMDRVQEKQCDGNTNQP
jgi:hypothetical protein